MRSLSLNIFNTIASAVYDWLDADCVIIGELAEDGQIHALAMKLDGKFVDHYQYALADTPCANVIGTGLCIYPECVGELFVADEDLKKMQAEGYVGVPIKDRKGNILGLVNAIFRRKFVPPPKMEDVLNIVALSVAAEIEHIHDKKELGKHHNKLMKALEGTVEAMSQLLAARDPFTAGHQKRVTELVVAIGKQLGLDAEIIKGLTVAALIHDIGKISVPAEILSKPGALSNLEYEFIKEHPQIGYDILHGIEFPWPIADAILQHHERLDGSGYPQGLSGENISFEARVLGVADVTEAMLSHRPYRSARSLDETIEELTLGRGIRYDGDVVDACLRCFADGDFKFAK